MAMGPALSRGMTGAGLGFFARPHPRYNPHRSRAISSVGQSACFTHKRSQVRALYRPSQARVPSPSRTTFERSIPTNSVALQQSTTARAFATTRR